MRSPPTPTTTARLRPDRRKKTRMQITTNSNGNVSDLEPHGSVAILIGEKLTIATPGLSTISVLSGPAGSTVTGHEITFVNPGRYRIKLETLTAGITDFNVLVCSPDCLDKLPASKSAAEKRQILRNLAGASWFNGDAGELANQPLGLYGA